SSAFDKAEFAFLPSYGLKAVITVDLVPEYASKKPTGRDYTNAQQNQQVIADIVALVEKNKKNPAILLWETGNGTAASCKNREAFAKFINVLAKAVHTADPHHPVMHSLYYHGGLRELAAIATEIDIFGISSYNGPAFMVGTARKIKAQLNRPTLFVSNGFVNVFNVRSRNVEEGARWTNRETWVDGVRRARPQALGGFFRTWRDSDNENAWGFVRLDGTPNTENIAAAKQLMLEEILR
ncbi:MAG: hypothetical protein AAB288_00390, partial [Acidobacteriota bacterium]